MGYDPFSHGHEDIPKDQHVSTPLWMLTIADLFSLILTFFVLLYSMSAVPPQKWDKISGSLQETMPQAEKPQLPVFTNRKLLAVEQADLEAARNLDYLWRLMNERFPTLANIDGIDLQRQSGRIVITLPSATLFEGNSLNLREDSIVKLRRIGEFLSHLENAVSVECYSNIPNQSIGIYPSNWEFSLARAQVIASKLRETGYPYSIDSYGMGNSRVSQTTSPSSVTDRINIVVRENVAKF